MDIPELVKIKKVVNENNKVKTFFLDKRINAKPGQFLMVWLPRVDEKPFSLSYIGKKTAITVERKGAFTKEMFRLKPGDKIGVRGPYGNSYSIKQDACVVAGGLGIAPLKPLIEKLKNPTVIFGVKTKKEFLLLKDLEKYKINLCTDDGSVGFKGFTTDLLKILIKLSKNEKGLEKTKSFQKKKKFSVIYSCGPEVMSKKVFTIAEKNKIDCEVSLERWIKCGLGVCGQCAVDEFRVCKDGPVFSSKQLRLMSEFGKYARLSTGKKVTINEYLKIK